MELEIKITVDDEKELPAAMAQLPRVIATFVDGPYRRPEESDTMKVVKLVLMLIGLWAVLHYVGACQALLHG